jgi:ribosomal protein L6P/L9E
MQLTFDPYTNALGIVVPFRAHLTHTYVKNLQQTLALLSQVQFIKMRFRGKGYYIYKTLRNTIAPNFGYAHRVYVYAYYVSLKFLSKTSIILFGLTKKDLYSVGYNFRATRPINIFTGRGVRFRRQIVYKKTGKVSTYR